MPDIPQLPVYSVTSILQTELQNSLASLSFDPLAGTGISFALTVNTQTVTQNADGSWNEVLATEASPVKDQNEIIAEIENQADSIIINYEQLASAYDSEILDYNNQINAKKNQIISLVGQAVGAGCSIKIPTGVGSTLPYVPGAENISGVAIGIGSTVQSDEAKINAYSNINNYDADTPFNPSTTVDISTSNLGTGYENITSNNTGTIISTSYRFISTNPADHIISPLTPAQQAACVGFGASIIILASEIATLRSQRDQYLEEVNNLKDLKTGEEVKRWGDKQALAGVNSYNTELQQTILDLTQYADNIVTTGLVVHYDSTISSGIAASVQSSTNINAVSQWNNLTGDGLVASPQTSLYAINLNNSDGPSVDLNITPTVTNQYFTIPNSFIGSNKIGTGNTSYSIEAWVKFMNDSNLGISSTTNGANIVGINSVHGYALQVYKPSGIRVSFGERGNGRLTNSTNLNLNTWYHIVATNSAGSESKIYVNGVADGTGTPINITSTVSNLQIGYAPIQISQYFSGRISVVRVYNKTLSQTEVTQNYDAHKARYGY